MITYILHHLCTSFSHLIISNVLRTREELDVFYLVEAVSTKWDSWSKQIVLYLALLLLHYHMLRWHSQTTWTVRGRGWKFCKVVHVTGVNFDSHEGLRGLKTPNILFMKFVNDPLKYKTLGLSFESIFFRNRLHIGKGSPSSSRVLVPCSDWYKEKRHHHSHLLSHHSCASCSHFSPACFSTWSSSSS